MKKIKIGSTERLLSEQIQHIAKLTQSLRLTLHLGSAENTNVYITTDEGTGIFPLANIQTNDLQQAIDQLEIRNWISIQQEPDLNGVFTLFINYFPTIYGYNYKKA